MNIDIIVAKLRNRGLSETNAKNFAAKLVSVSKEFGTPVSELIEDFNHMTLNELGDFITNNIQIKGYKTGRVITRTTSDIVNRTIIK